MDFAATAKKLPTTEKPFSVGYGYFLCMARVSFQCKYAFLPGVYTNFNRTQFCDGQLISTLQDINSGRRTEIESLNLEIAAVAARLNPAIETEKTKLLGDLILIKSVLTVNMKHA